MLRTIDGKWIEFLTTMEHFREGIGLQAYAQKDPLVEFKNEALTMFNDLIQGIQADVVANMFNVRLEPQAPPPEPVPQLARARTNVADAGGASVAPQNGSGKQKLGRNEPCWCGSGKKYKRCHGV